jgi:hypothetical protein
MMKQIKFIKDLLEDGRFKNFLKNEFHSIKQ